MSTKRKFDCDNTDDIICPYCGFEFWDSWEYSTSTDNCDTKEVDCQKCDKSFLVDIDHTTTYTSRKKEGEE